MNENQGNGGVSYVVDNVEFNPDDPSAIAFLALPVEDPVVHTPSTTLTDYATVYVDNGVPVI